MWYVWKVAKVASSSYELCMGLGVYPPIGALLLTPIIVTIIKLGDWIDTPKHSKVQLELPL
jgi:hypothetical protein